MSVLVRWVLPFAAVAGVIAALSGCSASDALNLLVSNNGYALDKAVAYGPAARQTLDVYEPLAPAPPGGRTTVVFFYGGSWAGGKRGTYKFVGEALASRGYLTIIPDYRVHPEAIYPVFVEDGAAAVRWAAENAARYGGNPDRIVVMGHSAGAHIAALLTLDRRFLDAQRAPRTTIKGFVGLAGPYSFEPLQWASTRKVFGHLSDPGIVRPVVYAAEKAPPVLLIHGADDRTVGPHNSADLAAALRAAGNPVTHIVYQDVAHVGIILAMAAPFRRQAPTLKDASAFIDELFASPPTVPAP